jgi:VCBS repeat-containing protein
LSLALVGALALGGCAITPKPIGVGVALDAGQTDRKTLAESTQAPKAVVTLEEAMARALLYNRERRVQMMESAMAAHQLAASRYDMLPQLAINAGYSQRDRLAASSSGVLENGQIVRDVSRPTYSVSASKQSDTQSLVLNWNVLDFGLSYLRAEQTSDRLLVAKERERKAVQNLIQDVRSAYWRAVSAQKLLKKTTQLKAQVQQALADSRQVEVLQLKNPMDALMYQRELMDIRRSLEALQKDLLDARTTLATLMGLPPAATFELVEQSESDYKVSDLKADIATLERSALALRPELMEQRYQARITESEGRSALLSLLPGASLYTGAYRDTNDFLRYSNWGTLGASLSLNLFNALKSSSIRDLTNSQSQVAKERRLALTAAVLGQVHLSRVALELNKEQYESASDYLKVVRKIRDQATQLRRAERTGELDLIREELAEILADLRRDVAYSDLQNSYGRVFVSAGLDPLPAMPTPLELGSVAKAMRDKLTSWDAGEVGVVLRPLADQAMPWRGPGTKSLTLAPDSFSLSGNVRYEVKQVGGEALPAWLKFDPATQTFSGNPPADRSSYNFEVVAVDASGAKASDRFVLRLENVNDAPQTGVQKTITAVEGGAVVTGKLDAVDPDGDKLSFALAGGQTLAPGFSIEPSGQWRFDPATPFWRTTKAGAKRQVPMRFTASDPHGGLGTLNLILEITGVNNPPEAPQPADIRLDTTSKPVTGRIEARDVDEGARLSFELLGQRVVDGFTLVPDGRWEFDPRHPTYQTLTEGDIRSVFVPVRVADEAGGITVVRLQITVVGGKK